MNNLIDVKKIWCLNWFLVSSSRIRIRIRFLTFWFAESGSGRKWTGSATLLSCAATGGMDKDCTTNHGIFVRIYFSIAQYSTLRTWSTGFPSFPATSIRPWSGSLRRPWRKSPPRLLRILRFSRHWRWMWRCLRAQWTTQLTMSPVIKK